jgi:glycosyltransferase involved in cell wall biosynthesis
MRVLYFHQHFSTPSGATGNRSYWMARCLIQRGHEVTVVCGSYGYGKTGLQGQFQRGRRQGFVDGIEVIEFDLQYVNADSFLRRTWTFTRFAMRSLWVALSRDYDVVFATSTPLTAGIPGIAARWLRRKRFVFEVRDLWPELPRAMGVIRNRALLKSMDFIEYISYRSSHRLVALAPGIADGIAKRGIGREIIAQIPNGCDLELFGHEVKPWRPDSVEQSDFLAVYAGTHGKANGLESVLDAASELQRRGCSNIKLTLIGDGMCKQSLQVRAASESLTNVVFHSPVSKARLAGLLVAADLGLQVLMNVPEFYFGTSPNKFFDYIAAGVPVLNNYPGWLAELINAHNCGFVVNPDDPVAFADALEYAATEPDVLKSMGRNARMLAEEQFDRTDLAKRFAAWLEGTARV